MKKDKSTLCVLKCHSLYQQKICTIYHSEWHYARILEQDHLTVQQWDAIVEISLRYPYPLSTAGHDGQLFENMWKSSMLHFQGLLRYST